MSPDGKQTELKPFLQAHAGELAEFYRESRRFFEPWDPQRDESWFTEAGALKWILTALIENGSGRALTRGLWLEERLIGIISFSSIVHGSFQSCYLGYKLAENHTGKGYMTEALKVMIAEVFKTLHLHRIEANVVLGNRKSEKLLERLGFIHEGVSRKYLKIAGEWKDHNRYVLFNETEE